ncbi:hypothetical protein CANINC_001742 [Pichia inconspicua]|uniref:CUE domain-containing protein n=1 Tax=Pichia inconspicua TaxID=52247 RepID=A0A4T0X375_9ASCO|nr:hypothetical protein CANINC_001742 [[Candida] inconspicua]
MESSTVTYIIGAIVVLIIFNYLFVESEPTAQRLHGHPRFNVTPNMISEVQAVAPGLSVAQIRADLQLTGSVAVTVDRYLSNSIPDLPQPQIDPISIKKQLSDNQDGNNLSFSELTYSQKKREMILKNRHKLQLKRGIVL